MVNFKRNVHCILGLPIDAINLQQAADILEHSRATRERCFFSTPNLNFVIASGRDKLFRESVCRSDLSLADGMPLIWVARLLGIPLPERVSGSGLFEHLRTHSQHQWKVFFFGGQRGVGQTACLAVGGDEPTMRPSGYIYPGMDSVEQMSREDLIDCINGSDSDLLVVSLGAAKGQEWICRNLESLTTPVVSHLGAVINFVAGGVERAPRWVQGVGLEWLWRIKEEPQLYRRYLKDGIALLGLLLTRVLPLALWQRVGAAPESDYRRATLELPHVSTGRIGLTGAWRADNLEALRCEFGRLCQLQRDVTLDMTRTTDFDSAFVALLLLLDQSLRDCGHELQIVNLNPRLRRLLRLHGVVHLYVE